MMRESRGEKCVQLHLHFLSWRGAHRGEHPAVAFLTFEMRVEDLNKMHHLKLRKKKMNKNKQEK